MQQNPLPGMESSDYIVNVASVPLRSPFRYPGGKTWLVPRIRQWLRSLSERPKEMIEPFAGGGIVGLTAAFEQLVEHVTFVELDDEVAAVWQTIIEENNGTWLAHQILSFEMSPESVEALLSQEDISLRLLALKTIIKNRVNRGGILAAGAGKLKHGENGKGIKSRWYPETLYGRIIDISNACDRLSFIQADGIEVLRENIGQENIVAFIDPPYTVAGKKAGKRLYTHFELDHEVLFHVAASFAGDFLMSYENTEEVQSLADRFGFEYRPVAMKNTHHARMTELLIGRNLDWLG